MSALSQFLDGYHSCDSTFGVIRGPDPDFTLVIEGPFRLVSAGVTTLIDPAGGPDTAYLQLVDKSVQQAVATRDGGLEITFSDGDRLMIPPDRYEPWQLNGDNGYLVVSLAGGGLADMSAKEPN